MLGRLERDGPATLTALARVENMRSQSMGAIVGPLEEAGFVAGAPDPNDGRQTVLSITALGRASISGKIARRGTTGSPGASAKR